MAELLLGIDIGTSACKVAAFTPDGRVVAQQSAEYPVYYPQQGWAEQNPEEWWQAVCTATCKMLSEYSINATDIKGIGIDGQSWSAIAVDQGGRVLCNTPIWMDTRSGEICAQLKQQFGEDELFALCQNPIEPTYTFPKILWYKQNLPQVYAQIHKILQSNSFIAYRLTGQLTQDYSQGYGLFCYDMKNSCWDKAVCERLGGNPDFLPELTPCHQVIGGVSEAAAAKTGLAVGTPVVAGGLDAACGTLGAGVVRAGQTQEQGGQAGGMSICIKECRADKRLILSNHVVPGLWLLQGGTVGGGGVVRWMEQEFCAAERIAAKQRGSNSFIEMDREASKIQAGSDGLVFLPYLAGERSPIWDAQAKGVYYGIDFSKTRAHFLRAGMEGVAFSLLHNLEVAEQAGAQADTLCAMGGAANSRLWTQIKADVTGKKIVVPSSDTATTLGAAILAGVGTGIYQGFEQAVEQTVAIKREHLPNEKNHQAYKHYYQLYRELYRSLKPIMKGWETQ